MLKEKMGKWCGEM